MELLSPAGGREALIAAVQNGADAVYLGVKGFNARRGAENFGGDSLSEAVAYCHARGARVYVTLNTMTREDEIASVETAVNDIYLSGADAFIVQDLGVARVAREIAPEMELHASTQMAVNNRQGVEFLAARGFSRVVLAREMDFSEIKSCAGLGVKLEAFVHGALCVACSGQCLFSSLVGARSGNRGMCAQPCRLKCRLGDKAGYLLSPRDLMGVEFLHKYAEAGVSSLKIEGRLKRPEYVAVVTSIYRRALDTGRVGADDIQSLRQIFNRGGFTRGYFEGVDDAELMSHARPNHSGVEVGRCENRGYVILYDDIDPADQLCLRGYGEDRAVKLAGAAGERVACAAADKSDALVRLTSEKQLVAARESSARENRATCLSAKISLHVGQTAALELRGKRAFSRATDERPDNDRDDGIHSRAEGANSDNNRDGCIHSRAEGDYADNNRVDCIHSRAEGDNSDHIHNSGGMYARAERKNTDNSHGGGIFARVEGEIVERARTRGIDINRVREQLRKTGGSGYVIDDIETDIDADAFISMAGINALRRAAISDINKVSRVPGKLESRGILPADDSEKPVLRAQSGDVSALKIALENGADELIFVPEDMRALDSALSLEKFFLALPCVSRAEELDKLRAWAIAHSDKILGVYMSNAAHLAMEFPGVRAADYMLNIANNISLSVIAPDFFTPSAELTSRQISRLGGKKDIIVYGRIPLMRLRHCPYRAAHNLRGERANCGVCDCGGKLPDLIDRLGARFPLRRIAYASGCIVEVLNSVPIMMLGKSNRLPRASAWRILITADDAKTVARAYRAEISGRGGCLDMNNYTTGHYFRGVE